MTDETNLIKQAAQTRGIVSRQGVMQRLFAWWFDSLVYNQIWEDPRVDREALQIRRDSRVLAIASGGCNAVSYLADSPAQVVALDINRYHIYLTRLKVAALRHLPNYEDFFAFFGCAATSRNLERYRRHVRPHLDAETRDFWEGGTWFRRHVLGPRITYFASNFYNYAKLGYLLRFAHRLASILRKDPSRLLAARTLDEQARLFDEIIAPFFDNVLVRLIGQQPLVLFSLGIPPQQFDAMRREGNSDVIALYRARVRRMMCDFPVQDNCFAWQALSRRYDRTARRAIPEYLCEAHYPTLKANAGRVVTHIAPLAGYLAAQPDRSFDRFVLLDSQDWMRPDQVASLWREIARVGRPGTRIIFRTGGADSVVERALPAGLRKRFVHEADLSRRLLARDRSAIYGGFHVYALQG